MPRPKVITLSSFYCTVIKHDFIVITKKLTKGFKVIIKCHQLLMQCST